MLVVLLSSIVECLRRSEGRFSLTIKLLAREEKVKKRDKKVFNLNQEVKQVYEDVYCSECGCLVCQSCGCCCNPSCERCSCPESGNERK